MSPDHSVGDGNTLQSGSQPLPPGHSSPPPWLPNSGTELSSLQGQAGVQVDRWGRWTGGQVGQIDRWAGGQVGQVDRWIGGAGGQVGRWTGGHQVKVSIMERLCSPACSCFMECEPVLTAFLEFYMNHSNF